MPFDDSDAKRFRRCRSLTGKVQEVTICKRNKQPFALFDRDTDLPVLGSVDSTEYDELVEEVCENLNRLERSTWLRLIDHWTISDIALADRVSRAAVLSRIRGNSQGHGGMVKKNRYVEIWWRIHKRKFSKSDE